MWTEFNSSSQCKMMLTNLFIIILNSLNIMATVDSISEEDDECGGPLSTVEFDDIIDMCDYYARCTQLTYKLNVNCLLSSCPSLRGVCPLNPDGSVNNTAINSTVSILNACMGQEGLICGINMSHTPMVQISWTTKNIFPPKVVNGTVRLNPGSGFLHNLSGATFTLIQTDNPKGTISLYIRAPYVTNKSYYNCTFNLTENSFLQPLTRQLTTFNIPNSLNAPNVFGTYNNNISCSVSIDLSTPTPTVSILDDQSDIDVDYSNFISADGVPLPQYLVDLYNQMVKKFAKNSDVTTTTINFLSTYVAIGSRAAQINCP